MTESSIPSTQDSLFGDIRPYFDHEVQGVLAKWDYCKDLEAPMKTLLCSSKADEAKLSDLFQALHQVTSVAGFQQLLATLVELMLVKTSKGIEVSGLERIDTKQPHLYVSNHRDIVLDPTLINYALAQHGIETGRVAIGDNLVSDPRVGDLMRANKSFLVKRELSDRREKLRELTKLSEYIRSSVAEGYSVWLAQREGRAKDGRDETESAVLKMLHLSARTQNLSVEEGFSKLNLVPVVISYEWNPCDLALAKQQLNLAEKKDVLDIIQGITGDKGRIHISFAPVLRGMTDFDDWVEAVDQQIQRNYWIFPSNLAAWCKTEQGLSLEERDRLLNRYGYSVEEVQEADQRLDQRFAAESQAVKTAVLNYYAQPLRAQLRSIQS